MPTAAPITTTAAPIAVSHLRRRRRRASRARIWATFSRVACLFLLPLDTSFFPSSDWAPPRG